MISNVELTATLHSDPQSFPNQPISTPGYPQITDISPSPSMSSAQATNTFEQVSDNITTTEALTTSQTEMPKFSWNPYAEALVLSDHYIGRTTRQIKYQLLIRGYTANEPEIRECLWKHGINQFNHTPKQPFRLDSDAEIFILSAHNHGQTTLQIATQLCKAGYIATGDIVVECLRKQGVNIQSASPLPDTFNQESLETEEGEESKKS